MRRLYLGEAQLVTREAGLDLRGEIEHQGGGRSAKAVEGGEVTRSGGQRRAWKVGEMARSGEGRSAKGVEGGRGMARSEEIAPGRASAGGERCLAAGGARGR